MNNGLIEKIRGKKARIAVIGLGHVGLPTAAVFADAGFNVLGCDLRQEVVDAVSAGKNRVKEPGLDKLLENATKKGKLKATTDIVSAVRKTDVVIICVLTPVKDDGTPNLTYLERACADVTKGLSKDKLVIVESTVPPGTTKNFVAKILEEKTGLRCGIDFWLAYCPERVLPGNAIKEIIENNRVTGGYDSESAQIAVELYQAVVKGDILASDCTTVEVAKVSENTFRYVNIAFANELALICEQVGVDVMEVIRLTNTHPRVMIHKPGCGVGGPCLPKDPKLLLHSVGMKRFESRVIKSSEELNKYMPKHTVKLIVETLGKAGKKIEESRIVVLGTAYKAEVDDARNSPAEVIIRELINLGSTVIVYDPYCRESFGARRAKDIMEAVRRADCIVIATDHNMFRELNLSEIRSSMNKNPAIIDCKRLLDSAKVKEQNFTYHGIGYNM